MKLLVVSDNHGDRTIIEDIVAHYNGQVDLMVHCGDSEMATDDPLFKIMPSVQGNNDYGQHFPEMQEREINDVKVLVTHGHLQNVNFTMNNLSLLAQEKQADIVAFGHTHRLAVTEHEGILFVNPGSISLPRGEYASIGGTFCIVTVDTNNFSVQYYDRVMRPISELKFNFKRLKN